MISKESILERINSSEKGMFFWQNLCMKYCLSDEDFVILLTRDELEVSYYTLVYLEQFINNMKPKNLILLTSDNNLRQIINQITTPSVIVQYISENEEDHLIDFFSLYYFSNRFIIASLKKPNGRSIGNLYNLNMMKLDEIVSLAILINNTYVKNPKNVFTSKYNSFNDFLLKYEELRNDLRG